MACSEKNIVVLPSATCYHILVRRKPLQLFIGSVAVTADVEVRTTQKHLNGSLVAIIVTRGNCLTVNIRKTI
jgi:hypothetical protein